MKADDFDLFYHDVHGYAPFPWQSDLVRDIIERGEWPSLIDVPTGLGKTSLLDIAVFLGAFSAGEPSPTRVGRRRVFFVVDRRVVVDQAARHARTIVERLESAPTDSLSGGIAARLRRLKGASATDGLLPVVTMRGGVTWDSSWLRRPDVPGIITGTVDQVGSRLFFRGYGVSNKRWPIDAALVGTDSVILVDEAHLATALTDTLRSAAGYDKATQELGIPSPVVVQLTATAREAHPGWIPAFDEAAHLAHPVAAQRLTAAKSLRLIECTKAAAPRTLADAAQLEVAASGSRVLVVCNTIDRARAVHTQLVKNLRGDLQPLLLIGRSRQFDREPVVDEALRLFGADRVESPERAVLVATQTVEVGVDLDATALVTECASWEALVQRIGRVNRRGDRESAPVMVVQDDDLRPPVYGQARRQTAAFLRTQLLTAEGLDVSPLALRQLSPEDEMLSPPAATPLLLPAHLDAWTRTAPSPVNDAPVEPYLHGLKTGVAPVSVAWRDGLLSQDGVRISQKEADQAVSAIPVRAEECIEVPISAVRRWLVGEKTVAISDWDIEDDWDAAFDDDAGNDVLRREIQPDGSSTWVWASANGIRPGDLIVVPSERGGLDEYGWAPSSAQKVLDVAELAALERTRRISGDPLKSAAAAPTVRLDDGLPHRLGIGPAPKALWEQVTQWRTTDDLDARDALEESCENRVRNWLSSSTPAPHSPWARGDRWAVLNQAMTHATIQAASTSAERRKEASQQFLLPLAIMRPPQSLVPWWDISDDTADGTSHVASAPLDDHLKPISLNAHLSAVAKRAGEVADHLGLPPVLSQTVFDAARWHDLGKLDPRFQAMLHGGDSVRALIAPEALAKSGMQPGDWLSHRRARARSGLPERARHEAWSEVLVAARFGRGQPYPGDRALLLHLVASHHGHGRPLLPPVADDAEHDLLADIDGTSVTAPLPRRVDLTHAERFDELNRRYGRWGLALLEAIVRCADMTVSGEGS